MTLASSIVIGVLLSIGVLNGFRRGAIREGMALIGVLLGALLLELWAPSWGRRFAQSSGLRIETAELLLGLLLLWCTAIFSGYGSALLLRRTRPRSAERLAGALLGLLNLGLLVAFTLRSVQHWYDGEPGATPSPAGSWIQLNALSRFFLEWTGLILLGLALGMGLAAIVIGTIRLVRLVTRPAPPAKPSPQQAQPAPQRPAPAGAATAAQPTQTAQKPQGQQEKFLDLQPRPHGGGSGGPGSGGTGAAG